MEENKNKIVRSDYVVKDKKHKNWFFRNWYKLLILLFLIFLDLVFVYGCKVREEYKSLTPNITVPIVKSPIKKLQEENGNLIADDYTEGFNDDSSLLLRGGGEIISYANYDRLSDNDKLNHSFYYRWNREYNSQLKMYDYYITIVNTTNTIQSITDIYSFDFGFETQDFSYIDGIYSSLYTFSYYFDGLNNYFNANLYPKSFYYDDFFVSDVDGEFSSNLVFNSSFDSGYYSTILYASDDSLGGINFDGWYTEQTFNLNPNSSFVFYLCSFSVIPVIQDYKVIYQNADLPNSLTYDEYLSLINSNESKDVIINQLQEQLSQYGGKTYIQIFNEGKNEGIASVQEGDLNNLFKTAAVIVFNSPYNILHNVFNFEFLGVNLFNLFSFLITCSIIIFIIKMVW